jgi:hypothetical protein
LNYKLGREIINEEADINKIITGCENVRKEIIRILDNTLSRYLTCLAGWSGKA